MKKYWKRLTCILFLGTLIVGASACGNGNQGAGSGKWKEVEYSETGKAFHDIKDNNRRVRDIEFLTVELSNSDGVVSHAYGSEETGYYIIPIENGKKDDYDTSGEYDISAYYFDYVAEDGTSQLSMHICEPFDLTDSEIPFHDYIDSRMSSVKRRKMKAYEKTIGDTTYVHISDPESEEKFYMSRIWKHFESNGKSQCLNINSHDFTPDEVVSLAEQIVYVTDIEQYAADNGLSSKVLFTQVGDKEHVREY